MIKTVKPARKINKVIQDNFTKMYSCHDFSTMTHWSVDYSFLHLSLVVITISNIWFRKNSFTDVCLKNCSVLRAFWMFASLFLAKSSFFLLTHISKFVHKGTKHLPICNKHPECSTHHQERALYRYCAIFRLADLLPLYWLL